MHLDLEEGEIYQQYIPEYVDDDHFDENMDDGAYQLSRTEIISQFHALKEDEKIDAFESFAEKQQSYEKFNFEQVKNRRRIIPLPKIGEERNKARELLSKPELSLEQNKDKQVAMLLQNARKEFPTISQFFTAMHET